MMKFIKFILLLLIISSCSNKNVQLPKLGEKGITEIYNTSKIWFFFNIENNDTIAVINKSNKITNTNLIFNIDKRLPLKIVIPEVYKIQEKLKEKSIHKTEGMRNYFSYADTVSKTFSLLDFTSTEYIFDKDKFDKNYNQIKEDSTKTPVILNIKINNSDYLIPELKTKFDYDSIRNIILVLKFDGDLPYQEYLSVKAKLYNSDFPVEKSEYIYNEE
ncbi:MAG: hypothetical protein ABFR05_03720 [Bacteroidota bacterium]